MFIGINIGFNWPSAQLQYHLPSGETTEPRIGVHKGLAGGQAHGEGSDPRDELLGQCALLGMFAWMARQVET